VPVVARVIVYKRLFALALVNFKFLDLLTLPDGTGNDLIEFSKTE